MHDASFFDESPRIFTLLLLFHAYKAGLVSTAVTKFWLELGDCIVMIILPILSKFPLLMNCLSTLAR